MEKQSKKLYRSKDNRILAGILGGLGEHFDLDPTLVRLVFAVLLVLTGFAPLVFLYLILWFVVPDSLAESEKVNQQEKKYFKRLRVVKNIVVTLVVLVVILGILGVARFFYHNVVTPWPHRGEFKNCLSEARNLGSSEETEYARYRCFRAYPHFL